MFVAKDEKVSKFIENRGKRKKNSNEKVSTYDKHFRFISSKVRKEKQRTRKRPTFWKNNLGKYAVVVNCRSRLFPSDKWKWNNFLFVQSESSFFFLCQLLPVKLKDIDRNAKGSLIANTVNANMHKATVTVDMYPWKLSNWYRFFSTMQTKTTTKQMLCVQAVGFALNI